MEKECFKCKKILDTDYFYINNKMKDKLDCYCKSCRIKAAQIRYQNNKEKCKDYGRKYSKEYVGRRKNNRKYKQIRTKPYTAEESAARNANNRKWRKNNKSYYNDKRRENPLFRMSCNLRSRTLIAFKNKRWHKNGGTETLLGCDWKSAHDYLENKFTEGMNWENYGEWHIDHIIPLSLAKTQEELIKLCHYTNLQPLWAKDNLSKNNKIINYAIYSTI